MRGPETKITTLLAAFTVLLVGHGLQLTLLPVYAVSIGWSGTQIGLTGSAYFFGFVTGCLIVPSRVSEIGHIRAFMVLAGIATAALLTTALLVDFRAWLALRFATGLSMAGLYMIVESWLTDISPSDKRGTVLSIYLAVSLLGMAVGQLPLTLSAAVDMRLFLVAAILMSIAIVPIGLTRTSTPRPIPGIRVKPATLLRASRVAVICAFSSGLVNGAFWTLGPVVGRAFGLDSARVGLLMSAGVVAGALAQYPVGRASDWADRRLVIGVVVALGAGISVVGAVLAMTSPLVLYASVGLICAMSMPLYGLCVAHAADDTELTVVEVTSGILLANGIGSIVGPLVAAPAITSFGPRTYFIYTAVCLGAAAIWTIHRYLIVERPRVREAHVPMLPRTTQAAAELLLEEEIRIDQEG